MVHIIVIAVILIVALVQSWFFSLPIRIPFIKRLAANFRTIRWTAIVLLGIIPTLVNSIGIIGLANYSAIERAARDANACHVASQVYCNSEEAGFVHVFNLDYSLKDELVLEVTLRDLATRDTCVSDNAAVCAAATYWIASVDAEQDAALADDEHFTAVDALVVYFYLTLVLSPSFMTAFDVYRLTRDTRKSKYIA